MGDVMRFEESRIRPLQAICSYARCGMPAFGIFNGLITGRVKHGKYIHAFAMRFVDLLANFLRYCSPNELEDVRRMVEAEVENRSTIERAAKPAA